MTRETMRIIVRGIRPQSFFWYVLDGLQTPQGSRATAY